MADFSAIFKAYDVRGRVEDGLDEAAARGIGAAFARHVDAPAIAVGWDCRLSSPGLARALIEGITSQGTDVQRLGEIPTDAAYFWSGRHDMPAAVITASHNPPEWNGIKLCREAAIPIGSESGLEDIRLLAEEGLTATGKGAVSDTDPVPAYIDHLLGIIDPTAVKPLRLVADGGNGMVGVALGRVLARLPVQLTGLYLEPDGTFPNHPADPLRPENLEDLLSTMSEIEPDLGVAFDGDADRAFFVDDRLEPVSGSTTTAIIGSWYISREPGARIVHNLITSKAVPETISAAGGIPVRTRVGHSYIKAVMADTDAAFGGEHSGHYYFRDNYRADSGMLALLVLLQVLSESGRPLSELRRDYEPYVQSGEINMAVEDKDQTLIEVEASVEGGEVDHLDGLTVDWGDRWFNLRPSNTEPVLRLNVEAADRAAVDELVRSVRRIAEGTR